MHQADLTDEQCQRLRAALGPHVAWLRPSTGSGQSGCIWRMDRRRWHSGDPLYQQVLTARREIERLDVLLMQISLVAGRRHRAASRRARLSAARLHAAKR